MSSEPAILLTKDDEERSTGNVCAANAAAVMALTETAGGGLGAFGIAGYLVGLKYDSAEHLQRSSDGIRLSRSGQRLLSGLYVWEDRTGGIEVVRASGRPVSNARCLGELPLRTIVRALAIKHGMATSDEDIAEP